MAQDIFVVLCPAHLCLAEHVILDLLELAALYIRLAARLVRALELLARARLRETVTRLKVCSKTWGGGTVN